VHVDVGGLRPATAYRYGFEAGEERSLVGGTRTLPSSGAERLRFGQVSCAKYNAGYFNAFARLAERDDLDFVLHLGDYIYEASNTPPASQTPGADIGRPFDPLHECMSLDDYRRRYAQYRSDPDVQAMHAAHPLIATLDDHELADGAGRDGGSEHDEERSGPWRDRRVSGDVHVGMANELAPEAGDDAVAVEFVNPSLTSQNLDDKMGWQPRTQSLPLEDAVRAGLPHIRWCDFDSHGYGLVDVTPQRLRYEWWAVDTVLQRTAGESRVAAWRVVHGEPRLHAEA
jgi:phosphodiesterase/alkaline phosphatase D-like protein